MSKTDPTIAEIQEVAATVLGAVSALLDRDAVIAGGFARDMICGIPSKDIDIWFFPDAYYQQKRDVLEADVDETGDARLVPSGELEDFVPTIDEYSPFHAFDLIARLLRKSDFTVGNPMMITHYNDDAGMAWAQDITKFRVNGVDIDLICLKEPVGRDVQALFDQFDFGICMAAIRGKQVIFEEKFQKDIADRTLTFYDTTRGEEDMDRVLNNHLPRLRAKFPTFKVKGLEKYGIT